MAQITLNIPMTFKKNYEADNLVKLNPMSMWRKELAKSVRKYVENELQRLFDSRERVIDVMNDDEDDIHTITYASKDGRVYTYDVDTQTDADFVCQLLEGDDPVDITKFTGIQINMMIKAAVYNAAAYHGLVAFPEGTYVKCTFEDLISYMVD